MFQYCCVPWITGLSHVRGYGTGYTPSNAKVFFKPFSPGQISLWVACQQQPHQILSQHYKTGWKSTANIHLLKYFPQNKPNSSWYAGACWSHLLTNTAGIYSLFWKAAITVWPQPGCLSAQGWGLPSCPPPGAQQCRAGCRAREATQVPRQGWAWHGLTFLSKRWCFPSSTKAYLPLKFPPASLSDLRHTRRPYKTSSPTQPGVQPRSLKLLHFRGRNHHVPKPRHPFWRNATIHGASRTASWARSCLSRQSYSISWVGWRFSHCNRIFLFQYYFWC